MNYLLVCREMYEEKDEKMEMKLKHLKREQMDTEMAYGAVRANSAENGSFSISFTNSI